MRHKVTKDATFADILAQAHQHLNWNGRDQGWGHSLVSAMRDPVLRAIGDIPIDQIWAGMRRGDLIFTEVLDR